ncbi:acyl-CoA dehydrogenase family protein [Drepanopeziza brunnea f. sp. 'multigermtubi' MB_m1]|uniref:Acyl-CoA dehydrogenase family protein n=1 Tax=Marssonina brunnea f. sp. multigermtubi (strain MB_m1) TaxID=1072389 RepID=K1WXP2_MARBU|nr:acyl-CoA dehydrogenase family protein [Drepanopeziza brunnea f. sp. 'multigermtubi' MB_m1]EKD17811.1 acyl-CoA dehydrogenase family protein [Drepanopeziza brunnea f. sp. 'multigermtubi' MB_m1]
MNPESIPMNFIEIFSRVGWIGIALPEDLGGSGLGISEATMMLQIISDSTTRHLRNATVVNLAPETLKLRTQATRDGDRYTISGQKINKPSEGLSPFFIDFDKSKQGLEPKHTSKMEGRAVDANEVFFDNYSIPGDSLIGNEDQGFKIVLHGMTAARCLLAGETLGLSYAALYRTSTHAKDRHPLADGYMLLEAAKLATYHAARLYDQPTTNVSVTQAAAFSARERSMLSLGGNGTCEGVSSGECFVPRIAPVSRQMVKNYFADKVLKLPMI